MGDHQHGEVMLAAELADDVQDFADKLWIERRGHFIEQHDFGPHRECAGDRDALLLTTGKLGGVVVFLVRKPNHAQKLDCAGLGLGTRQLQHRHRRLDAVTERRHMRKEVEMLEHHADLGANPAQMRLARRHEPLSRFYVSERLAFDPDHAAVDGLKGHQHAQYRRLAGARRPDDRNLLAARDVEIKLVEHGQ